MLKITFSHFVRLLNSQPYFVWNRYTEVSEREDTDLLFDIPSFADKITDTFSEVQAKTFQSLERKFHEKIYQWAKHKHVAMIVSKQLDQSIAETQAKMADENVDIIIEPVFSFKYKGHDVVANPKYYDKTNQTVGFLKIANSSKLGDVLPIMFQTMVMEQLTIPIAGIDLSILATKEYRRQEIDFFKTQFINTSKTGRNAKGNLLLDQLAKAGMGVNKKGEPFEKHTIYQIFKQKKVKTSRWMYIFQNLSTYLEEIIVAKNVNQIEHPQERDLSVWSLNQNWKTIMNGVDHDWAGFSGRIITKKDIVNRLSEQELIQRSTTFEAIRANQVIVDPKMMIYLQQFKQRVIWYDFEALSLPYAPIDNSFPFGQLVFQVSIIETNELQEIKTQNIVADPSTISLADMERIIDSIYHEGEYVYVVYNKSYENTRLREMINLFQKANHKKYPDLTKKVAAIIDNTIDLADPFKSTRNKLPLVLIPELKGNFSIKLIEKYIATYHNDFPYQIKQYSFLDVKNGMQAMEIANKRALGIIGDHEWEKHKKALQEYCENDVRAMIMVYFLIAKVVEQTQMNKVQNELKLVKV